MRLTCHYPGNKHAHVGTQRAGPEQAQGAVRFPGRETKKRHYAIVEIAGKIEVVTHGSICDGITSYTSIIRALCNAEPSVISPSGGKLTLFKRGFRFHDNTCPEAVLALNS